MSRILLNADIGERGPDHPVDRRLMGYVDIANIACGGHAGAAESVRAFRALAEKQRVTVAAHLSYPDKANFGRVTVKMAFERLAELLDAQLALMPDTAVVKFHGALYNDSCAEAPLAGKLVEWLLERRISQVITLDASELGERCRQAGIQVLAEAFAERRYEYSPSTRRLSLVSRAQPGASITDCEEALEQVRTLVQQRNVLAFIRDGKEPPATGMFDTRVDTLCIHSDSPIALELAARAAELLRKEPRSSPD